MVMMLQSYLASPVVCSLPAYPIFSPMSCTNAYLTTYTMSKSHLPPYIRPSCELDEYHCSWDNPGAVNSHFR